MKCINVRWCDVIKVILPPNTGELRWTKEAFGENGVIYFNNLSEAAMFGVKWSNYDVLDWQPYRVAEKMRRILFNYPAFINEKDMTKLINNIYAHAAG